jgi:hypothetical protein
MFNKYQCEVKILIQRNVTVLDLFRPSLLMGEVISHTCQMHVRFEVPPPNSTDLGTSSLLRAPINKKHLTPSSTSGGKLF